MTRKWLLFWTIAFSVGCHVDSPIYSAPLLLSFESDAEIQPDEGTARIKQSTEHATDGKHSLEAALEGTECGLGIRFAQPQDFTGASKLLVDIHRDGGPINVILRVSDDKGTYPVWYYRLDEGPNTCEFDIHGMASAIDVSKVRRLYLYVEEGSGTIFVDNVRLSKEPLDLAATMKRPTARPLADLSGNMLPNGDFELGLTGWQSWGEWDDGKYYFGSGFGEDAASGSASLKITCQKPGRGGVFTEPMFLPAGAYTLRFFAKGEKDAVIRWTFDGDEASKAAAGNTIESQPFRLTADWKAYSFPVLLRANAGLRIYFFSVGSGTVYIDAAGLIPQGGTPPRSRPSPSSLPAQKVTIQGTRFLLNGKPFFPVGIYLGQPDALANTGFNCIMPTVINDEVIQACERTGILFSPELTGVLRARLPWQAAAAIEPYKNHPLAFGWYVCDEPDHAMTTVPPPEMRLATRVLHQADPERLTWAVVMSWADSNMYQYADSVDVLATDVYPIEEVDNKRPLVELAHKTDVLRKAARGEKPVIMVTQASKKVAPDELTALTYLPITHGANGIFYWQFFEAAEDPVVWRRLVDLSLELKALTPVLAGEAKPVDVPSSDLRIHVLARPLGDRLYVIAINEAPQDVPKVELRLPTSVGSSAKVLFERRDVPVSSRVLKDSFGPYERHVYSVGLKDED